MSFSLLAESLAKLGQAGRIFWGNPQDVKPGPSPTSIEIYRRRVELRHALATVEAAIALQGEPGPDRSDTVNLDGLREDLLGALWLTEILRSKH